jgi:hypothetical protein
MIMRAQQLELIYSQSMRFYQMHQGQSLKKLGKGMEHMLMALLV